MQQTYPMTRAKCLAEAMVLGVSLAFSAQAALIGDVVETGGDNEATDTITAKWTGQTWNVTIANEPIPGAVVGTPYTAGTFGSGAPAFVDRAHRYLDDSANNLPVLNYLVGGEYILSGNDNRDNAGYRLDVTLNSPATVYMLIDNRLSDADGANPPKFDATHMQWILDQGWTATAHGMNRFGNVAVPDEVPIDEGADGTINQWYSVYQKGFGPGTFTVYQADNAGQNMYGVVVVPESGTLILLGLGGVAVLTFRRRL
jgi:hypothetical protein